MGLGDRLKEMLLEDDKSSTPTSSTPPPSSRPPSAVPKSFGGSYPTIGGTNYYATLKSAMDATQHPGNIFFVTEQKMKAKVPDDQTRYGLALDVSSVPKEQILGALEAREQTLQREINLVETAFKKKWSEEIETRDTRITGLTAEISSLQTRITAIQSEISSLTVDKDRRATELTSNKTSFDFAAQTAAGELDSLKQTIQQLLP